MANGCSVRLPGTIQGRMAADLPLAATSSSMSFDATLPVLGGDWGAWQFEVRAT
jgi:hypothetical protein